MPDLCQIKSNPVGLKESTFQPLNVSHVVQDLVTRHFPELEGLKVSLKLQLGQDQESWHDQQAQSHEPGTVQISTSNLEQLNWGDLPAVPSTSFNADLLSDFQSFGVATPPQASRSDNARLQTSNSMTSTSSPPFCSACFCRRHIGSHMQAVPCVFIWLTRLSSLQASSQLLTKKQPHRS